MLQSSKNQRKALVFASAVLMLQLLVIKTNGLVLDSPKVRKQTDPRMNTKDNAERTD